MQQNETVSTFKIQDETESEGEKVMDDPCDNSDLEAMKEELDDEEIRDVVPHAVTSLDEPVTYAEFFV